MQRNKFEKQNEIKSYSESGSVEKLVSFIIGKALDLFGIDNNIFKRWKDG